MHGLGKGGSEPEVKGDESRFLSRAGVKEIFWPLPNSLGLGPVPPELKRKKPTLAVKEEMWNVLLASSM